MMRLTLHPTDRFFEHNVAAVSIVSNEPGSRQRVKTATILCTSGHAHVGVDVQVGERTFGGEIKSLKVWRYNVGWVSVPLAEVGMVEYTFEE